MKWWKLAAVLVPFCGVFTLLYGCSTKDRPGVGGDTTVGPNGEEICTTEGAQRECHQLVGVQDGVKSCLHGVQVCTAGRWSGCGGNGTIEATNVGIGVSNLAGLTEEEIKIKAGSGTADAQACSNPCDPYCRGYDEDAGPLQLDAALKLDAVVGLNSTPPGFVDKLLRDKANSWGADCERWDTGNSATGWVHSACQSDYYCSRHVDNASTVGNCVQFKEGPNETHAAKLAGTTNGAVECADSYPDLTLGTPCGLLGQVIVPICNRGSAPVPGGTTIRVSEEVSSLTTPTAPTLKASPTAGAEMAACPTFSSNVCSVTLAAPLLPGACIRFSGAVSCAGALNGNKSLYVNSDKSIRECVIQPRVLGPPVSAHSPAGEQARQYGCANNYTAFNTSQIPTCIVSFDPKTLVVPYSPSCAPDERVQWGKLAWNASTPSSSEIKFEVRVRDRYVDGGFGPWSAWVLVGDAKQLPPPARDPAVCPMSGPAPCPKDLYAPLGGIPQARYADLELRITMNPDITGLIAPTLYDYKLAYSCVPNE